MPTKLSTTVSKIRTIPNNVNGSLIEEFYNYMKDNDSSERHQNNALKVVIAYTKCLGGSGKTQLCHTLCAIAPQERCKGGVNGKAIYIDT
jgi:Rad51